MGTEEKVGMFQTRKDALLLPNGLWMHFKSIERDEQGQYSCLRKKEGRVQRVKMYGGKVVENITQALAGIVVKESMVRMNEVGYRPILQVHDEVVALAPIEHAKEALDEINRCMTTVPSWAKGLPLAAEGDYALSYGDAK
jgi:DNA polymerase